jgi:hypothetical protein
VIAAIIVAVLVVVGGGVAAAIFLLGGEDDSSGGNSDPQEAAQTFVDAARAGDCEAAKAVTTEELSGSLDCSTVVPPENVNVEIGDPEITDQSDTQATASVPVTVAGTSIDLTLGLVNQNGKWLINEFNGVGGGDLPSDLPSMPSAPSISIPSFTIPSITIPSFTPPTN